MLVCAIQIGHLTLEKRENRRSPSDRKSKHRRYRNTRQKKRFVGLDGEGFQTANDQLYALLASSTGQFVYNRHGLRTVDCLDFLLNLREENPASLFCAFGFSYDVSMICRHLPSEDRSELWKKGLCTLKLPEGAYRLTYIKGKMFRVKNLETRTSITIYDTWGFFQSSFIRACERWGIGKPETIADMKKARGTFESDIFGAVLHYCIKECRMLAGLMENVRDALHAANLRPRSWHGAGAIAAEILRRENVKPHIQHRDCAGDEINNAIACAYFGGRVECIQQGTFNNPYTMDLNSAYPSAAIALPSYQGEWRKTDSYEPSSTLAIWRCRWDGIDAYVSPFPYRYKGHILYPTSGEGYYHDIEVREAIATYGMDNIEIMGGYVFEPDNILARPFDFIERLYFEREQAKLDGHPKEKVLKLGLNSIYGKLAQGESRYEAPYRCLYLAGRITATTRSRLLWAVRGIEEHVIGFATDGILSLVPSQRLRVGSGLGEWEVEAYDSLFFVQAGIYELMRGEERLVKTRGFFRNDVNFEALKKGFQENSWAHTQRGTVNRFHGIGLAAARNDDSILCRWLDVEKKMSLLPYSKLPPKDDFPPKITFDIRRHRLLNFDMRDAGLSEPYTLKDLTSVVTDDNIILGLEQPQVLKDA